VLSTGGRVNGVKCFSWNALTNEVTDEETDESEREVVADEGLVGVELLDTLPLVEGRGFTSEKNRAASNAGNSSVVGVAESTAYTPAQVPTKACPLHRCPASAWTPGPRRSVTR
jgi:hypothetical protein